MFDFRKSRSIPQPTLIGGEHFEIVDEYKYLGTIIENKLNWSSNIKRLYGKSQQRLYFLRKLHALNVDRTIMKLFYMSVVQSIFTLCLDVYYGNANQKDLTKLSRVIRQSQKLIGGPCLSLDCIYNSFCSTKVKLITGDDTHPLHHFYEYLRSGVRLKAKTNRFNNSFVPRSIRHVNSHSNQKFP